MGGVFREYFKSWVERGEGGMERFESRVIGVYILGGKKVGESGNRSDR